METVEPRQWTRCTGEMAGLIRTHDWANTPLDDIRSWPDALSNAVAIMLSAGAPLAIYWGPEFSLLYNDAWRKLIGGKHPRALGRPAREVFPEIWDNIAPMLNGVFEGRGWAEAEDQFLPLDRGGGVQDAWFSFHFDPLPLADGMTGGVLNFAVETTQRVQYERARHDAELATREREQTLRLALDAGRLSTWVLNTGNGQFEWSDEHYRLLGYECGEVSPNIAAWLDRVHSDDRVRVEAALLAARDGQRPFSQEFRVIRRDGEVHWLTARARSYRRDNGHGTRIIGVMQDATAYREADRRRQQLMAELQHRTRNLMSVVLSIAEKTARDNRGIEDFVSKFRDRLLALARVQGLLSRLTDQERITFRELIRAEFAAIGGESERVTLEGPDGGRLRSSTVQTLALAIHELTSNAVQYGALGQPDGRLTVRWSLDPCAPDESPPCLHIDWRESGVVTPGNAGELLNGQGREYVEKALPHQLTAKTTYTLGPEGVHCTMSIPISSG